MSHSPCPAEINEQEPLSPRTYFRIGGLAEYFVEPASIKSLTESITWATSNSLKIQVLGAGSNLLVDDLGVDGLTISLRELSNSIAIDGTSVTVGAGFMLPALAKTAASNSLSGVEFCIGIPGTVGGGLCSNAGISSEASLASVVSAVSILDGTQLQLLDKTDIDWNYRNTSLASGDVIIIDARLQLHTAAMETIELEMRKLLSARKATQPTAEPNAGSIFKNPPGDFAGRLIDAAGGKTLETENARVSRMHANFITHNGRATSSEILYLMNESRNLVRNSFGISLEPEIKWWGTGKTPEIFTMNSG
ncbi:MAG: UDP-N-acetylmuramate dehydrogenase [Chloroflexota bacterium]|nr:UDP-N-acetylmuramate dehydrogenase [Chloroflexota bacterium]